MTARHIQLSPSKHDEAVATAAKIILGGGVIIYPTDTLYGIGADATNEDAIRRVYTIKKRDDGKPLLMLADSVAMANTYASGVLSMDGPARYWPGPVTFVFKATDALPSLITGGKKTIGIRIPAHKYCLDLIQAVGRPIISTSANFSGNQGGDDIASIISQFSPLVDLIVDAGNVQSVLPSTIVDMTGETPRIIRQGTVVINTE